MIIGLTGTIASGKTTIALYLKKKGFEHFTYSDILRIEAKKKHIEPTRKNLQKLGNAFKEESNNGILSTLIIKNATKEHIVADGIRTVDEIIELKKHPNAYVVAVNASQKVRFERLQERKRPGDPDSFDQFKNIDDHENKGFTKGQEINNAMKHADFLITNDGNKEALQKKIDEIISSIEH